MSEFSIQVEHLSKTYTVNEHREQSLKGLLTNFRNFRFKKIKQSQPVLSDISFHIQSGEVVGILGRNGSGKSTLLRILAGIYKPDQGQVLVHGKVLPLLGLGSCFHPDLTGMENIFLNSAILGMSKTQIENILPDIISFSELQDKIYQPIKVYSSGMILRLAFSIASHVDAQILLLDEVLTVGDDGFRTKSLNRIREMMQSSKSVVLVTHDKGEIEKYCTRCIVIENSKIIFNGATKEGISVYENLFKGPAQS